MTRTRVQLWSSERDETGRARVGAERRRGGNGESTSGALWSTVARDRRRRRRNHLRSSEAHRRASPRSCPLVHTGTGARVEICSLCTTQGAHWPSYRQGSSPSGDDRHSLRKHHRRRPPLQPLPRPPRQRRSDQRRRCYCCCRGALMKPRLRASQGSARNTHDDEYVRGKHRVSRLSGLDSIVARCRRELEARPRISAQSQDGLRRLRRIARNKKKRNKASR